MDTDRCNAYSKHKQDETIVVPLPKNKQTNKQQNNTYMKYTKLHRKGYI